MADQPRHQSEREEPTEDAAPGRRSARLIWGLRAFGLVAALLVWIAMGTADGLSPDARWVATIGTLMAVWWMSEAIPLSVTSLLPIVLIRDCQKFCVRTVVFRPGENDSRTG